MDENIKYLQSEEKRLFELLGTLEHAYGRMHDKTREVFRDWCLVVDILVAKNIAL